MILRKGALAFDAGSDGNIPGFREGFELVPRLGVMYALTRIDYWVFGLCQ